ncbi:MAG: ATP-binding protein [Pseudobacter sp.]|uniref:ATP-binding protein n=1 Tax=Pseudobacter sp. TaxID=2045420 RepID=UPI003F80D564
MHELARVTLENEMDLILAHKRSMRLAELAGLTLSAQTTFATAVSEVSRNIIESGKNGSLILSVDADQRNRYIVACLKGYPAAENRNINGFEYAKRLVSKFNISIEGANTAVELFYSVSPAFRIDTLKIDEWRNLFRNEPPISPYEELKRKNEQLQELSERIRKSEDQYRILTNSLPLIIFTLNLEGELIYANEWLSKYTGLKNEVLNRNKWRPVVHPDDYDFFSVIFKNDITRGATTIRTQARLKNSAGEFLWHQLSLTPFYNEHGELLYWTGFIVDIHAQKVFEETLQDNIELKQTQQELKEKQLELEGIVSELNRSNYELSQFAFVASHDLQEPIRKILFYGDYLLNKYKNSLDEKAVECLVKMQSASNRMRNLIQDLLVFSQINKEKLQWQQVDLNKIALEVRQSLEIPIREKKAELHIQPFSGPVYGDGRMILQLFENLIGNSLKYSKASETPVIDISYQNLDNSIEIAFKDNGIGFNPEYLPKMFTLFQRLHTQEQYKGTGLGLAICHKIVEVHKGRIWATSTEGDGATFFVSLPVKDNNN